MRKIAARGMVAVLALAALAMVAAPAHAQKNEKRGDQTRLTRTDLDEAGSAVVTAYDAVRLLRPRWLQPPLGKSAAATMLGGSGGSAGLIVYVDDIRQPDLETSLYRVKAADIVEMKYLDQNRAVQEYGPGHEGGVIEVKTTRKPE